MPGRRVEYTVPFSRFFDITAPLSIVIAVFLVARLLVFAIFGAIQFPDTADYILYAERILAGTAWLHTPETGSGFPVTYIRLPGYPLIVAAAKLLAGSQFAYLIIAVQLAASLVATILLYRFAESLVGGARRAAIVAGFYAMTLSVLLDLSVLADSLVASVFIAMVSVLGRRAMDGGLRLRDATLTGIGAMFLLLLRGNGVFIAAALIPLAGAALFAARPFRMRSAVLTVALVAPLLLTALTIQQWNAYRTGAAFLSTGAMHVSFQPLFKLARTGLNPFDRTEEDFDRTVLAHAGDYRFQDIAGVIDALRGELGLSYMEITRRITRKSVTTLITHPVALARAVATGRHAKAVLSLANPIATGVEIVQDIRGVPLFPPATEVLKAPFATLDFRQAALMVPYALFGIYRSSSFAPRCSRHLSPSIGGRGRSGLMTLPFRCSPPSGSPMVGYRRCTD